MCSACKTKGQFESRHNPSAQADAREKQRLQRAIIDKGLRQDGSVRDTAFLHELIREEERDMADEANVEVRKEVAQIIRQAIEDNYEPNRIWVQDSRSGPNGGASTQVTVAIEDEDGTVRALAINVYCGGSIMGYVDNLLEEDRASAQLKADLGWT